MYRNSFLTRDLRSTVLAVVFGVAVSAHAVPSNDDLVNSIGIAGKNGNVPVSTRDASREGDEPSLPDLPDAVSVWYRYQAFARGPLNLGLIGAPEGSGIVVYVQRSNPPRFGSLLSLSTSPKSSLSIATSLNTTYVIGVVSPRSAVGDFRLAWKQDVSKDSDIDLWVDPASIHAGVQVRQFSVGSSEVLDYCVPVGTRRVLAVDFDLVNRGKEDLYLGEDYLSPWNVYSHRELWTRFTGFWRIMVRDKANTVVAMVEPAMVPSLSGTRPAFPWASTTRRFNFNSQGLRGGWIQTVQSHWACQYVDITGVPPGDYSVEVIADPWDRIPETDESNNSVSFPITLEAPCTTPPPNDNRENATVIEGTVATAYGDSACATRQPDERRHLAGSPANRSIWFQWTAPYSGEVVVSTEGSSFDTVLEVQGAATSGVNGPSIASNDDVGEFVQQSKVMFTATAGVTYWFAVDGYNQGEGSNGGTVVLNVNPAGNDLFSKADLLRGNNGETAASLEKAEREPGEPEHAGNPGGHSVWYRWVAPADGLASFDAKSTEFPALLAVYTGETMDTLTPVIDAAAGGSTAHTVSPPNRLEFVASVGKTYYIAIDGKDGAQGAFKLGWDLDGKPPSIEVSLFRRRNGIVRLTVQGQEGKDYSIFRCTDLENWTLVGHLQMVGNSSTWNDGDSPDLPTAYYRVVQK